MDLGWIRAKRYLDLLQAIASYCKLLQDMLVLRAWLAKQTSEEELHIGDATAANLERDQRAHRQPAHAPQQDPLKKQAAA